MCRFNERVIFTFLWQFGPRTVAFNVFLSFKVEKPYMSDLERCPEDVEHMLNFVITDKIIRLLFSLQEIIKIPVCLFLKKKIQMNTYNIKM